MERTKRKDRLKIDFFDEDPKDWPAVDNLSYQINLVHRLLDRQTKKFLNETVTLTSAERSVLGFVAWHSPVKIVDIAARTAIFKSQVSQAMKALERKGLVDRAPDPDDYRGYYFKATPEGQRMQKKIAAWTRRRQKTLAAQLSAPQRSHTLQSLKILARYLNSVT
jgi:DNA-binding MarR family transcriptional regulator